MESMHMKTPEQLDSQLGQAESFFRRTIRPESVRAELLTLDLAELKKRHPEQVRSYASFLQTEATLLSFPDIAESLGDNAEKPKIHVLPAGERRRAFRIDIPGGAHVIKSLESSGERALAERAAALGVEIGPKQFATKEGFLHEEFIEGTPLLQLDHAQCTPEFMEELGRNFMRALKTLHANDILVNDQILTNDMGKSHLIIDRAGRVRFIDFGAAVDLRDFPNLPDEAVLSLMRTDPYMSFNIRDILAAPEEEQKERIDEYRAQILSAVPSKEALIDMKDTQLLNEGLYFLQDRLPNVASFIEGVKQELEV